MGRCNNDPKGIEKLSLALQGAHRTYTRTRTRVHPHTQIRSGIPSLPDDGPILLYCRSGRRSNLACQALVDAGVDPDRLHDLTGGLQGWARDVDPSVVVADP